MITLTVIAFNDTPADGTLQFHFDELGGSIGRASTNQLVLPDPERSISRVAAQVVYRNGVFAIVDRGSNPIQLNGHALASGREATLAPGDVLRIGGYELSVTKGGTDLAAASDPFSGLLGPAVATPSPSGRLVDPLDKQRIAAARAVPAAAPPGHGIPTDWDPFLPESRGMATPGVPAPPRRDALGLEIGAAAPAALVPEPNLPTAAQSSLDQLFGLPPLGGGDPLADSVLDAPMAQPNMAADADPVRSLNSAPKASAASEADQLSDLHRPFIPPTVIKPASRGSEAPSASSTVMSWDAHGSAEHTAIVAKAGRQDVAPAPAVVGLSSPVAPALAAGPAPMPRAEDSAALLDAFRRGLNAPALELPALTPALMELIGELLHEAARGTVDLLGARASVKLELRAGVTTITTKNNNPLKFSPNAEVALQHLLAPPARGFIPAASAMRGAYDDLRTHQFAFVAAMQAVLEAALQRFDPVALESQLGEGSLLHSLLPASRHARLWEMFTEHYARIRKDATDDFHTLFGKTFLTAYDEHVKRLQDQRETDRPEA